MVLSCLPVGGPPAGQQLVQDRTLTTIFFTPSESEAPSPVFSTGPYRTIGDTRLGQITLTDLYAHTYPGTGGTAPGLKSLRPTVEKIAPIQMGAVGKSPPSDILGRLFLTTLRDQSSLASDSDPFSPPHEITRYDPQHGTVGPVMSDTIRFSPSRARVFAVDFLGGSNKGTLFDLEVSRDLTDVSGPVFVEEDFYYVAVARSEPYGPPSSSTLLRIKPNAEPEVLLSSSQSLSITAIRGGQTPHLLVHQSPAPSALPTGFFMLDLETLASTPIPADLKDLSFVSASPSGRWLLFMKTAAPSSGEEIPTQTLTLFDWTTGARTDLSPPLIGAMELGATANSEWRPGHDELWIQTDKGTFKVIEPGDLVTAVPLNPGLTSRMFQRAGTGEFSIFTRDGQHWFSRSPDYDGSVYLAWVDDPTLPPLPINPQGTVANPYWEVGDGRLLVGASPDDAARQELFLVDPVLGTSRVLAGGGQVVAVGKSRALTLLAWDGGRNSGTLTLIDLASGAQTVLAEDVYVVAVDPGHSADVPPDTDILGPGTEIAFLSRGRFDSPYDGLWVTRLP